MKRGYGQRDASILGPLAAVDVDPHTLTIDVGDLQTLGLLQTQAAGVDHREKGALVRGAHTAEESVHLCDGEYRR
jgi:hypothetical protein